jgi:hypothetical protein
MFNLLSSSVDPVLFQNRSGLASHIALASSPVEQWRGLRILYTIVVDRERSMKETKRTQFTRLRFTEWLLLLY